jgi:hypothetical protein
MLQSQPRLHRVSLTQGEIWIARTVGLKRHELAVARGAKDRWVPPDPERVAVMGVGAEIALAKFMNRFWSGGIAFTPAEFSGADVGTKTQARWASRDDGDLGVRDHDNHPGHAYVLLTGGPEIFFIRGWMWDHEAKQDRFWRTNQPYPAWMVPQRCLRDPAQLRGEIVGRDGEPTVDEIGYAL